MCQFLLVGIEIQAHFYKAHTENLSACFNLSQVRLRCVMACRCNVPKIPPKISFTAVEIKHDFL